jgi:hypothetical protein
MIGLFFGPHREEVPTLDEVLGLRHEDAVLTKITRADRLRDGFWPLIGSTPNWNRANWPAPEFAAYNLARGGGMFAKKFGDDLRDPVTERQVNYEEFVKLPSDARAMSGTSVERELTHRIEHAGQFSKPLFGPKDIEEIREKLRAEVVREGRPQTT